MPAALTYPGVYVEEISSGIHTITGVATSIAAFVGWAPQGPVDEATLVQSTSEFAQIFGGTNGLDPRSLLGYAVNQFFANGGQQCYIVRLVWDGTLPPSPSSSNPQVCATAVATGVGYATALISATFGSVTGSTTLGIGQPVLQSISFALARPGAPLLPILPGLIPALPVGATLTLAALGTYSDGTTPATALSATWQSSNPNVTVTSGGSVTVVGGGTAAPSAAAITATVTSPSGTISGSIALTIVVTPITSISVTPATLSATSSLGLGQTLQYSASVQYQGGASADITAIAQWTTTAVPTTAAFGAPGQIVVSPTGDPGGTLDVEAALPWTPAAPIVAPSPTLTVTGKVVTALTIEPSGAIFSTGSPQQQYSVIATYSDGSPPGPPAGVVTWSSSNLFAAKISSTGEVTIEGTGTATITASYTDTVPTTHNVLSATTTCTVTTATLKSIVITPQSSSVASGLQQQLTATGIFSDGTTPNMSGFVTWTTTSGNVNASGVFTSKTPGAIPSPGVTGAWMEVTGSTELTVTAAVPLSIGLEPSATDPASGSSVSIIATATLSDGTKPNVTNSASWVSSNPSVATIPSPGLVKIVGTGGSLTLFAQNPGAWGNNLRVSVTVQPPSLTGVRFSVLVQIVGSNGQLQTLESFANLSVSPTDPQYCVAVIDNDSNYITFINPATIDPSTGIGTPVVPSAAPSASTTAPIALSGGADGEVLVPATDQNFELALLSNPNAGVFLLSRVDIFNLLCIPGETDAPTIAQMQTYCNNMRALFIVDAPQNSTAAGLFASGPVGTGSGSITGINASNSAYYFPWVFAPDPLFGNRPTLFPPCGFVAGIYAATDASRGVWKAPAGIDASLTGDSGLQYNLTDAENGNLNPQAVNCLRHFKVYGEVVWGARTLAGNDQAGSQWKYVPIRRLALYIESSLYDGTQWVVFEPNDETLWGQIRLNVGTFMQGLFLQGAFAGTTPQQAYFVKCDDENNPDASVALGVVNILVGFAPLYPAEFVVIQIQQIANQGS